MSFSSRRNFLQSSAVGVATLITNPSHGYTTDIRKITPPNFNDAYLGQRILCYRPMRHGPPNLSVVKEGNKVIAHNYGHD